MTAVADLKRVSRIYPMGEAAVHALDGVDLRIPQGEYLAIMGQSGSGKSTLLNVLGCLDRPTDGTYHLDGKDVSNLDDDDLSRMRNLLLGFVFLLLVVVLPGSVDGRIGDDVLSEERGEAPVTLFDEFPVFPGHGRVVDDVSLNRGIRARPEQ